MEANATNDLPEFLEPLLYRMDDYGEKQKIEAEFLVVVGLDQERSIKAIEEWEIEQARLASLIDEEETEEAENKEE